MAKRSNEPVFWLLFSAGGVMSAMLLPVLVLLFGLAFPLGWIAAPDYDTLLGVIGNPLARLVLFALCSFSLFHWAHRFRYSLYDGLQIKHLHHIVDVLCYGAAIIGTFVAGYLAWTLQ